MTILVHLLTCLVARDNLTSTETTLHQRMLLIFENFTEFTNGFSQQTRRVAL